MTPPSVIHATPVMSREESARIYRELRETVPSEEKRKQLEQADETYRRAVARKRP